MCIGICQRNWLSHCKDSQALFFTVTVSSAYDKTADKKSLPEGMNEIEKEASATKTAMK